jgi:CubicO group peptidase (beta-lactamase class C family)
VLFFCVLPTQLNHLWEFSLVQKFRAAISAVFVTLLLWASACPAQQPQENPASPLPKPPAAAGTKATETPHDMTATDVEAFLDGFLPMQLQRENIAGAVVLVVKDGKVLFSRGYGYSDMEKKTPVSPENTLFRPGSISKLFTWTAVMQLVEQNNLDLDRDINSYLDFKIPATFPQPITLRHLMTHTAGFEEQIKDLINSEGAPIVSLREHLTSHMPERIYPPGTTPAYSNYGASLAGYIVERVSGKPFNQYVSENIFTPLAMARSTFAQPLPPDLKPLMSGGYIVATGKAKPFEIVEEAPAGGLSATAADLANFMIAHLQDGKLDSTQILRPETARTMHSRQFGLHQALNGMCLGFYEETRNGHRIIGHGGDTVYFHSDMHLVLDAGVGFYVSYNSRGKGEISPRTALWNHFLDRYFPYKLPVAEKLPSAVQDGKAISGHYIASRRSESNFLKIGNMLGQGSVKSDADGKLTVDPIKDYNGETKTWEEIGPLLYRATNGQELIAFRRDDKGKLQMVPNFPAVVYQHATMENNGVLNQALTLICLVIMALTLLFWPAGALIRRHYHSRLEMDEPTRQGRLWIRLVCALNLIFVLGMLLALSSDDPTGLNERADLKIHLLQAVGVLGAAGIVLVFIATVRSWRDRTMWWWSKFWNFMVLAACAAFVWISVYWNLLDFNLNY